ncbi:MAG: hypothetical protein M3Y87_28745, partial [Myxococcota bacterium]|nr:hypothetical protein [Myxococcota bacterium]
MAERRAQLRRLQDRRPPSGRALPCRALLGACVIVALTGCSAGDATTWTSEGTARLHDGPSTRIRPVIGESAGALPAA